MFIKSISFIVVLLENVDELKFFFRLRGNNRVLFVGVILSCFLLT